MLRPSRANGGLRGERDGKSISMILLPPGYRERDEYLERAGLLTYITWRDIANSSIGIERVRELASSMQTESLLIYISTMSSVLNWNLDTFSMQQGSTIRSESPAPARMILGR